MQIARNFQRKIDLFVWMFTSVALIADHFMYTPVVLSRCRYIAIPAF